MPLPAMKVDLKSLGTIQTMIGAVIFMFGIVTQNITFAVSVNSAVMYWGSLCFFISGALAIASVDYHHPRLVKSSLVMNLISTVAASVALVVLFVDVVRISGELPPCQDPAICDGFLSIILLCGTFRVLLVFSVLEICVSIWTFVLTWKTRDSLEATS
ncbi:membrane-spanning 4-domains subfamily A member 6A-like [Pangasianodon hypophthalmus]|uniref:membrane-spanning 4-domains subfamily A member 6A-like n=1 Tax=Pangasianodon hypophthalmus TaxID=310915 RepID=UPI0023070FF2|nr:membrane-spanning 4-domains subfamily A member 6A-like [Pangasianodon hypophthalmus]